MRTTSLMCPKNCDGSRGNRDLTHKKSLHGDVAVGKLLPQSFLEAFRAYERAGVKNFSKRIFRRKSRVDHTLTREFVAVKMKMRQIGTITEWFGNLTCQKEGLWEIQGKIVWWIIHLPSSLLRERSSHSSLIQLPSETGIWPVKKNELKKFEAK